jgi:hypothetical protein
MERSFSRHPPVVRGEPKDFGAGHIYKNHERRRPLKTERYLWVIDHSKIMF